MSADMRGSDFADFSLERTVDILANKYPGQRIVVMRCGHSPTSADFAKAFAVYSDGSERV